MPLRDVEELCRGVVPGNGAIAIEPLGSGLLSDTYRIVRDGAAYTLKIAAERDFQLSADLAWEVRLLERAAAAGVAPPVAYADTAAKILLMRWVAGQPWSSQHAKDPASIGRIAMLLRSVHALEVPAPPRRISPAQWIEMYAAALARRDRDAGDVGDAALRAEAAARVLQLAQWASAPAVVCHSDLHALNLIEQGDTLVLLDWEYAHVADPLWDLAGWCANNDWAAEPQWRLLADYLSGSPASRDWQRLRLNLWLYDYVCLLWSRLCLSRPGQASSELTERARLLDARLRLPAHYAA